LVIASFFFYGCLDIKFLLLLFGSIIFNFVTGRHIAQHTQYKAKISLAIGIVCNIGLLGYFKYTNFAISTLNSIGGFNLKYFDIALPLGISFYTFQQIAFLVDTYRKQTKEYNLLNYVLFVSFFPKLLLGPIVLHKEFFPQINNIRRKILDYKNILGGTGLFIMGLFKKIILADTFLNWANYGFDNSQHLELVSAWITSLSYTFQLYFDFSGYTDMALGIAWMFNIRLPINFNKPYLSLNIQDFWRRWHITLSRFIKNYIYIPLGGNRKSGFATYRNLILAFLIGGVWHGAGWTFVFWGFLHGIAMALHRYWQRFNIKMPNFLAWFLTFNFVNICWVFFRANNFENALNVLNGMIGLNGIVLPLVLKNKLASLSYYGIKFGPLNITDLTLQIKMNCFMFYCVLYLFIINFHKTRKLTPIYFDKCKCFLIREMREFLWCNQKWWILPILFIMILIGGLIFSVGGKEISSFVYTQF
jgi:D-alanyl-lipoteichoic acid acyltransferase DltB (MBOAT superfamily)